MKKYFVFRVAKGFNSGEPSNGCPLEFKDTDVEDIFSVLNKIVADKIPYHLNNYQDYLHKEFWHCGKLRQGWGAEGLDLRLCPHKKISSEWIKNFVVSLKRDWATIIEEGTNYCQLATGRFNILKHMLYMGSGDIIIVPKHSYENRHDDKKFVICEVLSPYYFDLNKNYRDFGHTIVVKIIRTCEYKKSTIIGKDFQPYQKAINKISDKNLIKEINRLVISTN